MNKTEYESEITSTLYKLTFFGLFNGDETVRGALKSLNEGF